MEQQLCATTLLGAMIAFGFYPCLARLTDTGYRKLAEQTTPAASPPMPAQPQHGAVPT
ncbi:hypothetical protein ACIQ62_02850 [Streptomyces sp. NPDC096319]|uniref:hypothetical protein n=1 Tax=Streptomyces sp. NPDC096319 TaxID=3366084 RepID=UPI0037FC4113